MKKFLELPAWELSMMNAALRIGVLVPLCIVTVQGLSAQELDLIEDGRALVTMYCADCHATGPEGDSPLAIAPAFRDLHLRYDVEFLSEALVEGIVTAHPEMPQFEFEPQQAAAIVEYLKTLER